MIIDFDSFPELGRKVLPFTDFVVKQTSFEDDGESDSLSTSPSAAR